MAKAAVATAIIFSLFLLSHAAEEPVENQPALLLPSVRPQQTTSSERDGAVSTVQITQPGVASIRASYIPVDINRLPIDGPLREFKDGRRIWLFRPHHRHNHQLQHQVDEFARNLEVSFGNDMVMPGGMGEGMEVPKRIVVFRSRRMGKHHKEEEDADEEEEEERHEHRRHRVGCAWMKKMKAEREEKGEGGLMKRIWMFPNHL